MPFSHFKKRFWLNICMWGDILNDPHCPQLDQILAVCTEGIWACSMFGHWHTFLIVIVRMQILAQFPPCPQNNIRHHTCVFTYKALSWAHVAMPPHNLPLWLYQIHYSKPEDKSAQRRNNNTGSWPVLTYFAFAFHLTLSCQRWHAKR